MKKRKYLIPLLFVTALAACGESSKSSGIVNNTESTNNIVETNPSSTGTIVNSETSNSESTKVIVDSNVTISVVGYQEAAIVSISKSEYSYKFSYLLSSSNSYVKVDDELILEYTDHYEACLLGLKAGSYRIKVDLCKNDEIVKSVETNSFDVISHTREGFAFTNGYETKGIGAYDIDGTLKSGAQVIYVSNENARTVTADIVTNSKGTVTTATGLGEIFKAKQKGYDKTPLCIRFIGKCDGGSAFANDLNSNGYFEVKGKSSYTELNITLEGVGRDATLSKIGVLLKNATSVEVRNLGIMLFKDDGISMDTDNSHLWIHNNDIFYGMPGSDSDQAKGDGSCDTKANSRCITVSFNHFFESGKALLCGMKSETAEDTITYHHNWFDHSDSRHPRVRTMTVHVYNNFYDGVSKYGVGATMGSSVFVENNYFLNTKNPMLISLQGTDVAGDNEGTFSGENGGIIKSYGNAYVGTSTTPVTYQTNNKEFDCYEATSKNEIVPTSVVASVGGTTYSNFDIASTMYSYNVESPEAAMNTVKKYAGRIDGGDFSWEFTSADNTSYEVNTALKAAILAYNSQIIGHNVGGSSNSTSTPVESSSTISSSNTSQQSSGVTSDSEVSGSTSGSVVEDVIVHNFTIGGTSSSFFTISGNLSTSKGTIEYNGLTLTQCLKLESSTSISFTTTEEMTLILVFNTDFAKKVKIDGDGKSCSNGILEITLAAGSHTITKGDTANLYYISLSK